MAVQARELEEVSNEHKVVYLIAWIDLLGVPSDVFLDAFHQWGEAVLEEVSRYDIELLLDLVSVVAKLPHKDLFVLVDDGLEERFMPLVGVYVRLLLVKRLVGDHL